MPTSIKRLYCAWPRSRCLATINNFEIAPDSQIVNGRIIIQSVRRDGLGPTWTILSSFSSLHPEYRMRKLWISRYFPQTILKIMNAATGAADVKPPTYSTNKYNCRIREGASARMMISGYTAQAPNPTRNTNSRRQRPLLVGVPPSGIRPRPASRQTMPLASNSTAPAGTYIFPAPKRTARASVAGFRPVPIVHTM